MTDAPRASVAVWPRSLRRSPLEQAKATGKWRDNIRRGGSRDRQSERTTGNRGDLAGRFPAPRTARSGVPGTVGEDVLLAMAGMGARQGTEPPGTDGFLRRFLAPYYHRESIRSTTVAIGWEIEQHSRTGFDSASIFLEN